MRIFSSSTILSKFLFCFFLVCSSFSFAQEKDSLDQYSYEDLTEKFQKVRFIDTKLAKQYILKILEIARTKNDDEKLFFAYRNLAKTEDLIGDTDEAITHINKAIKIANQKLNSKEKEADCIFTKAYISYNNGMYEEAFSCYTKVYNYYRNTNNKTKTNQILINIALLKNILGDQDGAIQLLLKNYKNYQNLPEKDRQQQYGNSSYVSILSTLSNAYIRKAIKNSNRKNILLDSASIYNKIGLLETEKTDNITANVAFRADKGIILEERDRIPEALNELNASLNNSKDFKQPNLLTAIYYHKGICHKKLNQIDDAILYLKKTDSITEKTRTNYAVLQNAYYALAKIYIERKDYANSTKYLQSYIENDLINDEVTETVRKEIREKHDIGILQEKIKKLNNEIKEKSSKATTIISLLMSLLFCFFIFHRYQKQKNKAAFNKIVKQLDSKKKAETISIKTTTTPPITIDDEKIVQVLKALEKFEEKEWFRNKNCDLAFVAKKAKTNKTYLSKIIHTHKQLKFIDYIRDLRIDYALERLKNDTVFRSYDIKSIAEESGFKSSDMFSRAFVKNTGIYPSYYIKNINKINT